MEFSGPQAPEFIDDFIAEMRWMQNAPTPQDPDRMLIFSKMKLDWWVRWMMKIAPSLMIQELGDLYLMDEVSLGLIDLEMELKQNFFYINEHPAIQLSLSPVETTETGLLDQFKLMAVWTGEDLVVATVVGSQPISNNDEFFLSLTPINTAIPTDPDQELALLNKIFGGLLLVLLMALVGAVYMIDKALKRRKERRVQS